MRKWIVWKSIKEIIIAHFESVEKGKRESYYGYIYSYVIIDKCIIILLTKPSMEHQFHRLQPKSKESVTKQRTKKTFTVHDILIELILFSSY